MSLSYKARWVRIAGISKRIKEATPPPHWRCEIQGESGQYLIVGWTLLGEAMKENNTQGTKPSAKGEEFLAWVSYYGDILIGDDQHVTITLLPAPKKKE